MGKIVFGNHQVTKPFKPFDNRKCLRIVMDDGKVLTVGVLKKLIVPEGPTQYTAPQGTHDKSLYDFYPKSQLRALWKKGYREFAPRFDTEVYSRAHGNDAHLNGSHYLVYLEFDSHGEIIDRRKNPDGTWVPFSQRDYYGGGTYDAWLDRPNHPNSQHRPRFWLEWDHIRTDRGNGDRIIFEHITAEFK